MVPAFLAARTLGTPCLYQSDCLVVGGCTLGDCQLAQLVKNLPAIRETWVRSQGWEDPLEVDMATHSLVSLPGESPWAEEPGELQSMELQRVGYD